MPFIYFMSLKLIKTTQKCLILWNSLGVLINIVLIKKFQIYPSFTLFPWNFSKPPKYVCYFQM